MSPQIITALYRGLYSLANNLLLLLTLVLLSSLLSTSAHAQAFSNLQITARPYPARPGSPVTFEVSGATLPLQVDFDDGSQSSIGTTIFTHTFQEAGHFKVIVRSAGLEGGIAISQQVVTVTNATIPQIKPTSSSTLAVDEVNRKVWIVNPDSDSISRISLLSGQREVEVDLGDGCHPTSVALDQLARPWVTCHKADSIKVISSAAQSVRNISLAYGSAPFGIAPDPAGSTMFVSAYGKGSLLSFNSSTLQTIDSISLGETPRAIAVSTGGDRVLVTRFISKGNQGEVWDISCNKGVLKLTRTIPLHEDTVSPETTQSGRGVPNYLAGVALHPSGQLAWVSAKKDNSNRGTFLSGVDLNQENAVRAIVSEIDLATGSENFSNRRDVDNSDSPNAVAFSPLGDYAFVGIQGARGVVVYDLLDGGRRGSFNFFPILMRIGTGIAPQGVVFDHQRSRVLVQNFLSRSLSFIDAQEFLRGSSGSLVAQNVPTTTREKLTPQVLRGKQIFYTASDASGPSGRNKMSGEGYLSCATCHIDGGHDGRVWDFTGRGEGLRNTTDLRGRGGTEHGRVHWSANFDEIQDFENDIRNHFGGSGFMSDPDFRLTSNTLGLAKAGKSPDLDALAAYVSSLDQDSLPRSPYRNSDGSITAAGLRGATIFTSLGCQNCHSGSQLTDSRLDIVLLHNIGTITAASGKRLNGELPGIDTPTLLGIFDTPPYLHDGRSARILDLFSESEAGIDEAAAHRAVLALNTTQRNDLEAFLLQLDRTPLNFTSAAGNGDETNSTTGPALDDIRQAQVKQLTVLFRKIVIILKAAQAQGQLTSAIRAKGIRILGLIIQMIRKLAAEEGTVLKSLRRLGRLAITSQSDLRDVATGHTGSRVRSLLMRAKRRTVQGLSLLRHHSSPRGTRPM